MRRSSAVLAVSVLLSCFQLVGQEPIKKCDPTKSSTPFRVAYPQHFKESGGNTLSLRVSIGAQLERTPDLLYRVGCAVAAKYRNEESWNLLIFSDYKVAKNYTAPDSEQSEPPEYIGACIGVHDAGEAQVRCGRW
jgi:hypothetical protein